MAGILSLNRGLTRLDMAANDLSGDAEETLIRSLEQNRRVLRIDLRRTSKCDTMCILIGIIIKRILFIKFDNKKIMIFYDY